MSQPSFAKRGISLLVVLSMMLAATLAATALYVLLSRYQARSASALYTESALAAAKAGESATKAWLTYEGEQVRATLQDYLNQSVSPKKAFKLGIGADYQATANARGQSFDAYLLDVIADSTQPNAPISVKVQINAIGPDGSEAISTVVYNLKGLQFQKAPPIYVTPSATVLIPDAMHISGNIHIMAPLTITGSAYVENFLWQKLATGNALNVTGSLVFGINSSSYFNDEVNIGEDLYVAGAFSDGSGADVTVEGNSVFKKNITKLGGNYLFKGDLYCARGVGAIDAYGAPSEGIRQTITVKGNTTIDGDFVSYATSSVHLEKDLGFINSGKSILSLGSLLVDKNAAIEQTACFNGVTTFNGIFLRTLAKGVSTPACQDPGKATDTDWDGWQTAKTDWAVPSTVTPANQLPEIQSTLNNNGAKDIPFSMSLTQLEHLADNLGTTWDDIFGYTTPPDDWRGLCDNSDDVADTKNNYSHKALNCLATSMPVTKRYNGFVLLDLRGVTNLFETDIVPLNDKFILIMDKPPLPQTTASGRVLVYYVNNLNNNLGVAGGGSFYGAVYSQQKLFLGTGSVHGTLLSTFHDNDITQAGDASQVNAEFTVEYDSHVLDDLLKSGLMLDKKGDSYLGANYKFESNYTLSLLSPRLQVDPVSTLYGATSFDPGSALPQPHTYSLVVSPTVIAVNAEQYTDWSALIEQHPVDGKVLPNSPLCTEPAASFPHPDLAEPGTYNVIYTTTCTQADGSVEKPVAHLLVWVRPTSTTMTIPVSSSSLSSSSSSSDGSSSTLGSSSSKASSSSALEEGFFAYQFKSCPETRLTTNMSWGVQIGNGTTIAQPLSDFRATYFLNENSKTAKNAFTTTLPTQKSGSSPDPVVTLVNATPNAATTASKPYNLKAVIHWPEGYTIPSNSYAGFDDLKWTRKDAKSTFWTDDYSYDGCHTTWDWNERVVFERKDADGDWQVVSGTLPDYEEGHRIASFDSDLGNWTPGISPAVLARSTAKARHGGGALKVLANSNAYADTARATVYFRRGSYDSLIVWAYTEGSNTSAKIFYKYKPSPWNAPSWIEGSEKNYLLLASTWNRLAFPLNISQDWYTGNITFGLVFSSPGTYYIDDVMFN